MSAMFGFTFLHGRMTEVLTPDIYGAHWARQAGSPRNSSKMAVIMSVAGTDFM